MLSKQNIDVPLMADLATRDLHPEYLFWVGCAGAFDDRYKKVAKAFAGILNHLGTSYAVLGMEESCTGDPARRAGNEMLFQMQALQLIETFKAYQVKKIITICPHCYNVFRNEYPDLGGSYEVVSYVDFLEEALISGRLKPRAEHFKGVRITYHDPCYLGRNNGHYDSPRRIIRMLGGELVEMRRNRAFALCCGAGGGQMFKEAEPGDKEVFMERTEEAMETGADVIATACPFCMTMMTDGIKYKHREDSMKNYDIAEILALTIQAVEPNQKND